MTNTPESGGSKPQRRVISCACGLTGWGHAQLHSAAWRGSEALTCWADGWPAQLAVLPGGLSFQVAPHLQQHGSRLPGKWDGLSGASPELHGVVSSTFCVSEQTAKQPDATGGVSSVLGWEEQGVPSRGGRLTGVHVGTPHLSHRLRTGCSVSTLCRDVLSHLRTTCKGMTPNVTCSGGLDKKTWDSETRSHGVFSSSVVPSLFSSRGKGLPPLS